MENFNGALYNICNKKAFFGDLYQAMSDKHKQKAEIHHFSNPKVFKLVPIFICSIIICLFD